MLKLLGGSGGVIMTAWLWWKYVAWPKLKTLKPILEKVIPIIEEAAKDKVITKPERKKIAWGAINEYCKANNVKLGPVERLIIDVVIDKIAKALPDFNIPDVDALAKELVTKAIDKKGQDNG